ncbi:hypothetical protein PTTG_08201 [Puccinia triticina 1-1 BBBD Race 1]|uniref:TRUD domain-containing protein n=1 Tax=Puccinia triticina (isolate 1-1 / race 1 (BBBD)) TaxID=630390 RepID=A0A180G6Y6_PUCT1|nr:hypothetical protein PTTG_08201 [Puccinia triticina 1-1 BBBD Race 1]WAR64044.1 hypothetical protein PtB15_16B203 [Puccinia triticina]
MASTLDHKQPLPETQDGVSSDQIPSGEKRKLDDGDTEHQEPFPKKSRSLNTQPEVAQKQETDTVSNGALAPQQVSELTSAESEKRKPLDSQPKEPSLGNSLLDSVDMTQTCLSEQQVGISKYINPNLPTFSAILKHRFTDFMVHEVNTSDQVIHLKDIGDPSKEAPREPAPELPKVKTHNQNEWPENAHEKLLDVLGQEKLTALQSFVEHGPPQKGRNNSKNKTTHPNPVSNPPAPSAEVDNSESKRSENQETSQVENPKEDSSSPNIIPTSIISDPIDSKDQRKRFHQAIREVFQGRLITEHKELDGDTSAIEISWARPGKSTERRPKPVDQNPPYIHFTLQKTNRETQDALSIISRTLHCHVSKDLAISGTKDKRSVSCQRVSFKRGRRMVGDVWATLNNIRRNQQFSEQITFTQRGDKGIRVGDFTYENAPLKLGELNGNRFTVVLRDVNPAQPEILKEAVKTLSTQGFLNYFGMQRFGTTSVGTHIVGLSLLQANWDLAIDLIMRKKLGETQDSELARSLWEDKKDAKAALDLMPRRCVAERCILQFFSKQAVNTDKCGALASIPKNLKMMYIHAYQSYIWNTILSRRVELYGCDKPVVGDLVQLDRGKAHEPIEDEEALETIDDAQMKKSSSCPAVKVLKTVEDCQAFTIYDVVLPLVGYNIVYPENELGEQYLKIIRQDGLDPDKLYRSQAEYSMGGTYRKILHLPRDVQSQVYQYEDPDLPLTQADEDSLLGFELPDLKEWTAESAEQKKNLALKVEFTLGSSAYATMALREILKSDTGKEAQSRMTQRLRERMVHTCPETDPTTVEPTSAIIS